MIFRAEPGRVFVGGDISQQEPKITAHISQDPNMLKVFREGKDIYASIAQSIYHNSYEDNLEFFDKEKTKTNLEGTRPWIIPFVIRIVSTFFVFASFSQRGRTNGKFILKYFAEMAVA